MTLVMMVPLIFLSLLAFWKPTAVLFMLVAGISIMVGLEWYDVYVTPSGLAIGLMLIGYSITCLGYAFKCLLWEEEKEE